MSKRAAPLATVRAPSCPLTTVQVLPESAALYASMEARIAERSKQSKAPTHGKMSFQRTVDIYELAPSPGASPSPPAYPSMHTTRTAVGAERGVGSIRGDAR